MINIKILQIKLTTKHDDICLRMYIYRYILFKVLQPVPLMYTISYGIPLKFLLAPHPHPYFAFTTSVYFNANMSEGTWVKWVLLFNDERRIFHWSSNYLVWNGWYIIQQPFAYFWNLLDDNNSQITPPQKLRLIKAKLRTCPFLLSTIKNVLMLTKHDYEIRVS